MTVTEFLESNEFEDITIHGSYYTISRRGDNNWMVYSFTSLILPSFEYTNFTDALTTYLRMEREQHRMVINP